LFDGGVGFCAEPEFNFLEPITGQITALPLVVVNQAVPDLRICSVPSLSPDGPLDECQEIQLGYKDNTRCPPVGIVYWPPPPDADAWPRLLSFKPLKLHRVLGGNHTAGMSSFFSDVRRVLI
jgi:hypothetical protein